MVKEAAIKELQPLFFCRCGKFVSQIEGLIFLSAIFLSNWYQQKNSGSGFPKPPIQSRSESEMEA
jgi:hypothetical protein